MSKDDDNRPDSPAQHRAFWRSDLAPIWLIGVVAVGLTVATAWALERMSGLTTWLLFLAALLLAGVVAAAVAVPRSAR